MEEERVRGEVVLYHPADTIRLEVRLEQETMWLTQDQISVLFGKDRSVSSKFIWMFRGNSWTPVGVYDDFSMDGFIVD